MNDNAPALDLATSTPTRGTTGVALGYPGGGGLTVTAAGGLAPNADLEFFGDRED